MARGIRIHTRVANLFLSPEGEEETYAVGLSDFESAGFQADAPVVDVWLSIDPQGWLSTYSHDPVDNPGTPFRHLLAPGQIVQLRDFLNEQFPPSRPVAGASPRVSASKGVQMVTLTDGPVEFTRARRMPVRGEGAPRTRPLPTPPPAPATATAKPRPKGRPKGRPRRDGVSGLTIDRMIDRLNDGDIEDVIAQLDFTPDEPDPPRTRGRRAYPTRQRGRWWRDIAIGMDMMGSVHGEPRYYRADPRHTRRGMCQHVNTYRGHNVVSDEWARGRWTEVCHNCGAWRPFHNRTGPDGVDWLPRDEYEEAVGIE